ncbi:hypothetical protein NQZ68_034007 [Dissostichus eleginoides]|nr:hypothetical protein NQZ68_034007 [Dissostichus eleginoides]
MLLLLGLIQDSELLLRVKPGGSDRKNRNPHQPSRDTPGGRQAPGGAERGCGSAGDLLEDQREILDLLEEQREIVDMLEEQREEVDLLKDQGEIVDLLEEQREEVDLLEEQRER